MALTATANKKVVEDAIRALGMRNEYRYQSSFNRPNLHYEVRKKDKNTVDIMADHIAAHRNESGVIYCLSRKDCETLTDKLNKKLREKGFRDVRVSFYHAELDAFERKRRHHDWSLGKISVLCATIAVSLLTCPEFFTMNYIICKLILCTFSLAWVSINQTLGMLCITPCLSLSLITIKKVVVQDVMG